MLAGQFQTPPDRQAVASETSAPESGDQHGKICALVVVASRENLTPYFDFCGLSLASPRTRLAFPSVLFAALQH